MSKGLFEFLLNNECIIESKRNKFYNGIDLHFRFPKDNLAFRKTIMDRGEMKLNTPENIHYYMLQELSLMRELLDALEKHYENPTATDKE